MNNSEKKWLEDFKDFMSSPSAPVAPEMTDRIARGIRSDLQPSPWLVFAKLLGIHSIVGTLSLAICDQFGVTPFQTGFSLSHYFMRFGSNVCMALCGSFFVSLSVVIAWFVLKKSEYRVFGNHPIPFIGALGTISLGVFWGLGAEIFLQVAVMWLLGALIGGIVPAIVFKPQRLSKV